MSEYLYKTPKGYVIAVYRITHTVMGDIVCYSFNDESVREKIRDSGKGHYIVVRQHGKYYGRCYI